MESLDLPADVKSPIDELLDFRLEPAGSRKRLSAELVKEEGFYRAAGADRCARSLHASTLSLNGASVEDAYRQVGLPLPPKPPGW